MTGPPPSLPGRRPEEHLRRLGELLPQAVGRDDAEMRLLAAVVTAWPRAVGPAVSAHVEPVRVEGTTVVVRADSGPWATQVRRLGGLVTAKLTEEVGRTVEELRVLPPGPVPGGRAGSTPGSGEGSGRRQRPGRVR